MARASSDQRLKRRKLISLNCRLVGSDSTDSWETHGKPRFVTRALVDRIERDFEHERLFDLAHRTEALDRVAADPAVEPFQLVIGEAEIGLADGEQFTVPGPATEGVIAVIARSLSGTALGVHQHAIGSQRIALPFVPKASSATADIRAVAALQHDARSEEHTSE